MNNLNFRYKEISQKNYSNGNLTFEFRYELTNGKISSTELLITDKEANVFVSRYSIIDGKVVFSVFDDEKVILSSIDPATMRYLREDAMITVPFEELASFLESEYLLEIRELAPIMAS